MVRSDALLAPAHLPCPDCGDAGEVIEWYDDVQVFRPCPCGLAPTGTAGTAVPADEPILVR